MPSAIRSHRLLLLALAVGIAAVLVAVLAGVFDADHARAAADAARSSWGRFAALLRSGLG